jgi:orotidine-5'-phosphate decarboxylase
MEALESVCAYARTAGLIVVADAKRGDIGSTARAVRVRYLEPAEGRAPLADAMTVNPYLGLDSLEPFIAACRREGAGIFCLVKTSNEGVADIQELALSDGKPLWQHVASLVAEWGEELVGERGLSSVGAVVGATHPRASARRGAASAGRPAAAGIGAQGARPARGRCARSRAGPASVRWRRASALGALRAIPVDPIGATGAQLRASRSGAPEERGLRTPRGW